MDPLLWQLLSEGNPDDEVEVLIKVANLQDLPTEYIFIVARIGDIVSCRIRRADIEIIRQHPAVVSMKAARQMSSDPLATENFEELPDDIISTTQQRRPNTSYTGKDVAVGIADWGFDFTHPNFIDENGDTRFIALWDQGAPYDGENTYGYGTVFYKKDINEALNTKNPFRNLGYHPGKTDIMHKGMHGTHVLDIAAGNGTVGESGMAPNADLIAVHLSTKRFKDLMGLGDSVRLFDALHFLDETAQNQALVINLSVGNHGDAHTGKSLIEQAIDNLVSSKPNRAIVQSCGNYRDARTHTEGILKSNEIKKIEWIIDNADKTANEIEIWYNPEDEIHVSLIDPSGRFMFKNQIVIEKFIDLKDIHRQTIGRYYHRAIEPNSQLNQINIFLDENAKKGSWIIELQARNIKNGKYSAYIERDNGKNNQSRFSTLQAVQKSTLGSICNGFHSIVVGAYDATDPLKKVVFFSSEGTTWDDRQKPDFLAPGWKIKAAKSAGFSNSHSDGKLKIDSGTSMAAPYVAGSIALLYEAANKDLTIEEVKKYLLKACEASPYDENTRYGSGYFSPSKLVGFFENSELLFEEKLFPNTQYNDNKMKKNAVKSNKTGLNRRATDKSRQARKARRAERRAARTKPIAKPAAPVSTPKVVDTSNNKIIASNQIEPNNDELELELDPQEEPIQEPIDEPMEEPQSLESILESYDNYFGNMTSVEKKQYFDDLPKQNNAILNVQKGDLIVRRQYGHHEPLWHGVVESVEEDNSVVVKHGKGRKRISISKEIKNNIKLVNSLKGLYIIDKYDNLIAYYEGITDETTFLRLKNEEFSGKPPFISLTNNHEGIDALGISFTWFSATFLGGMTSGIDLVIYTKGRLRGKPLIYSFTGGNIGLTSLNICSFSAFFAKKGKNNHSEINEKSFEGIVNTYNAQFGPLGLTYSWSNLEGNYSFLPDDKSISWEQINIPWDNISNYKAIKGLMFASELSELSKLKSIGVSWTGSRYKYIGTAHTAFEIVNNLNQEKVKEYEELISIAREFPDLMK